MDRSMTVPVSVFENLRKGGPVSVPVLSNMDEKPDWTGLPSTRVRQPKFSPQVPSLSTPFSRVADNLPLYEGIEH